MNCAGVERYLDALIDREIDVMARVEVERHLVSCEACTKRVAFSQWLKRSLKQEAQVAAPAELRDRIQAALREEEAPAFRRIDASWRGTAAVAALALCVFGLGGALELKGRTAQASVVSSLFEDVVRAHSRRYPAEVAQGEQVPVYFQERVGFRVTPVKFDDPGVRFLGARGAEVAGRKAVTLQYDAGGHRITVVAFRRPAQASQWGEQVHAAGRTVRYVRVRGHLVPLVEHEGVVYAVVGDLDSDDPLKMAARASLR